MKISKQCLYLIFMLSVSAYSDAYSTTCTEKQFEEAESVRLKDWKSIHQYFNMYEKCDDADLSEMTSNTITHMIASHWNSLYQLEILFRQDKRFKTFILKHINETADYDDISKIEELSQKNCNIKNKEFCNDLYKQSLYIKKQIGLI